MYAVIRTGGKQERVTEGQRLSVELLDAPIGSQVELDPVLIVDGPSVLATPEQLAGTRVTARVLGETQAKKIRAGTYKSKTNQRRRWGHRQRLSAIEIVAISAAAPASPTRGRSAASEPAGDTSD
jgi:large subunit ribosomal protein L21